jgi:hypothetical protein
VDSDDSFCSNKLIPRSANSLVIDKYSVKETNASKKNVISDQKSKENLEVKIEPLV